MSDIFDHALDAYESGMSHFGDNGSWRESSFGPPDPLFFHYKLANANVLEVTRKATLLRFDVGEDTVECWYPSSWVRYKGSDIYIWKEGFLKNSKNIKVVL